MDHAGHCGEGLSARRRDADSPRLARHDHPGEVENRAAGVPSAFAGFRHWRRGHPAADPDQRKVYDEPQRTRAS